MIKDYGNVQGRSRLELQTLYGEKVLNTVELQCGYTVHSFLAPFVSLTDTKTGEKYTAEFQHSPRYYFSFEKVD